jgi:cell division protein FtsQ
MDRSIAGRAALGHAARPRGSAGRRARPRPARRASSGRARRALGLPRAPGGVLAVIRVARGALGFVAARRRLRITLLVLALALPLLAGGWTWLRHSPLASVQHVQVSGLHGAETGAIEAALVGAAKHMSTLDVRSGKLRSAVAPFRVVREVRAYPSFPHGLRIRVIERLPVAALTVGGSRTAVAADGVVLGPALLSSSLPTLNADRQPPLGQRVQSQALLAPLIVLGAAPAQLAKLVSRVYSGPKGLTVAMRSGLLVFFGSAERPHAKWLSLASVLADPSSAAASYVDVRVPERPAAGFPAGVSPPASSSAAASSTGERPSGSEPTIAAFEAGLAAKGQGASSTAGEAASTPSSESSPTSSTSESTPAAPSETGSRPSGEPSEGAVGPSG